jgi:hypothetical protein
MNPIQKALTDIQFQIPKQILEATFIDDQARRSPVPVSLEYLIREKVINARVMVDMNLAGGMLHNVPLDKVEPEYVDEYSVIFRIPKALTQGRSISRVLALSFGDQRTYSNYASTTLGYNTLSDAANGVLNSQIGIPMTETTNVRLLSENTVLLQDLLAVPGRRHLRCYLDNDEDLAQMRSTVVPFFSQLCVSAVKSYIYNNLIIPMGRDVLVGGRELGRFREVVDSYSDQEELYQTFITEKWRKINMFNDTLGRQRLTKLSVGAWH